MDRMVMASAIPFIAQDFHLSPLSMGAVLSAFFAGYTVMQIPGGLLADRFGPRAVLTISIAWWSVLTALTGMASGLTTLLTLRVLFGVGEGPFPSAAAKTLSIWFPQRELGQANGLLIASTLIGATVAPLFTAALIASWGWRSVFFALFTPGLVLAVVVWRFVQNSPPDRKQLTPRRVTEYRDTRQKKLFAKTNLGEILRTPTVLWCAACAFLSNMLAWGLLNWLPTYLLQARGFGIAKMGMFVALTNLAGVLGYPLGGYICDKYFASRLNVPILIGLIVGGVLTYLAATAPTGEWAVAYLVLAGLLGAIGGTALYTLPLTVVPKYAVGGAFGIVNTAGQLAGVFSPLLVGYILKVTDGNFQIVLYWLVGISILAVYPAARLRQSNVSGVQPAV
jgi:sugar phosphate permease